MNVFLFPLALGLLSLLPVVVIMYLLKLKRTPSVVPSTLLWRRSVSDMVANAPFQRLRNNLLLWLQLLILLLLILALARPVLRLNGMGGESIIVLLDLSASMQTEEESGETRLDQAKRLALKVVEDMRGGSSLLAGFVPRDEMMIIGFADTTFPLQTMTSDKGALRNAIYNARALDTESNMKDAGYILQEKTMLVGPDGVLSPNPRARVVLISDGNIGPSIASLADVSNVDYALVGASSDNQGIVGVDVRESFVGTFEYQIFASIYNSAAEPRTAYVELVVGKEVMDLKKVELEPKATKAVVFTTSENITGLATLRLADHTDGFKLDDAVQLQISPPTELKILLVTRGNPFLERVFNVDPRAKVSVIRPGEYQPRDDYDITVFDDFSPPVIGTGNYIFHKAVSPGTGYQLSQDELKNPRIIDWSRVHPLTRFTNFERVLIGAAMEMQAPKDAVPLVQAAETDLISYHESDTRRVLVIGFDVLRSYWPLDPSFPIFFSNVLDTWARSGRAGVKPAYPAGQTIALVPPREATTAEVLTADGTRLNYNLEEQSTIYLTETRRGGLYTVRYDKGGEQVLPVSLLSAQEADITPVPELEFGGRTVTASVGAVRSRQEIWPWLVLVGLGVLLVEWRIYCRRSFM